jgi:hypothetical protein
MSKLKPTARQIENLRTIHALSTSKGAPPTISDLRKSLSVSSDQAVIELLEGLERRGLIERTPGQARSLALTKEGYLTVGEPIPENRNQMSSVAQARGPELTQQQLLILKRLADIDTKLAMMYRGALHVLRDSSNPESIAQSAHSIREITHLLSDTGKQLLSPFEKEAAKKSSSNNARQLEKVFDPLGGVPHLDHSLYDTWNKDFHQYFIDVCHHRQHPTLLEYQSQLARYEDFLCSYVLPRQTEIYDRIDSILFQSPELTPTSNLTYLLSRNVESYGYFFRNADSRWLAVLSSNGFLRPTWEVAGFLARIAPDAPYETMAVIESLPTTSEDWPTRRWFVDAVNRMPATIASSLVGKIEKENWLTGREADLLSCPLNELLETLIRESLHDDALRLSRQLLRFELQDETNQEVRPASPMRAHCFKETLKRFSNVTTSELPRYIRLLVALLSNAIRQEHPTSVKDESYIWRPAIEDHEQTWRHEDPKDLLISAIRSGVEPYAQYFKTTHTADLASELNQLLESTPAFSVFKRLKLHLFRLHLNDCLSQIETAVIEDFDNVEAWHEYSLLLGDAFQRLTEETRTKYLELVDKGPSGEHEDGYIRRWKTRKLSAVRMHLSASELDHFKELEAEAGRLETPNFLSTHGATWIGPTSPKTEEDLSALLINAVVEHLATWTPVDDRSSPSRKGLSRTLSALVAKNGEDYSADARRFYDQRIRPVYLHSLFLGFGEALKNKADLNWDGILSLASDIVRDARSNKLPQFELSEGDEDFETKWDGVYQQIASLLKSGLANPVGGLPFGSRSEIWSVIEFLCEHPDPTPEYEKEYGGDNMDPATLSINTVRGMAFHALFAYIFWCDRHHKTTKGSDRLPPEARKVLESHLDTSFDERALRRNL